MACFFMWQVSTKRQSFETVQKTTVLFTIMRPLKSRRLLSPAKYFPTLIYHPAVNCKLQA